MPPSLISHSTQVSYCRLLWGGENIFSLEVDLLSGVKRRVCKPGQGDECI